MVIEADHGQFFRDADLLFAKAFQSEDAEVIGSKENGIWFIVLEEACDEFFLFLAGCIGIDGEDIFCSCFWSQEILLMASS